jgi:hypothetical protein
MTHLKADVATFLSYRQNNRKKNFNILMTHLKVDVATFLQKKFATSAFKWVIKILKFFFPIILSVRKKCSHISLIGKKNWQFFFLIGGIIGKKTSIF